MSVRTSRNLDLIVAFLEKLAVKEQMVYICQLHTFVKKTLDDKDVYGEVRKQLEIMDQSFNAYIPINYKEVANNISKYL